MAAPEDTKFQVNFKLSNGNLINLYSASKEELESQLQSLSDLAQLILSTGGVLENNANVAYAVKSLGATVIDEPVWAAKPVAAQANPAPTAPAGSAPACLHGPMVFKPAGVSKSSGKPYNAFYACPSSDRANQCKAQSA
jgi:hypothetical protein